MSQPDEPDWEALFAARDLAEAMGAGLDEDEDPPDPVTSQ